jgi:hypothetical protein
VLPFFIALAACGEDGGSVGDAGLDAQRRLGLTVNGSLSMTTYMVKVTIEANGTTRIDTVPVAGLPATVDLPAPIQLGDWNIDVDALSMTGSVIGRGMTTVTSGTADATVTVSPVP